MKLMLVISTFFLLPVAGFAQSYKAGPAQALNRLPTQAPGYIYLKAPTTDNSLSKLAMANLSKRPIDRQVDSVYNNIYKTDVPVFYENTRATFRRQTR